MLITPSALDWTYRWEHEDYVVDSPDGAYQAVVVMRHGLRASDFCVRLRPRGHPKERGDQITSWSNDEAAVRWRGPRTLVVRLRDQLFLSVASEWRDVQVEWFKPRGAR